MCHISRENVWRIIEKASLPRKTVGTRLKGMPFKLKGKRRRTPERAIKRFERKGETFPPVWRNMQQARIIAKTYQRERYPTF